MPVIFYFITTPTSVLFSTQRDKIHDTKVLDIAKNINVSGNNKRISLKEGPNIKYPIEIIVDKSLIFGLVYSNTSANFINQLLSNIRDEYINHRILKEEGALHNKINTLICQYNSDIMKRLD